MKILISYAGACSIYRVREGRARSVDSHVTKSNICSMLKFKCSVARSCLKRGSAHLRIVSIGTLVESGNSQFCGPFVKAVSRGVITNRSTRSFLRGIVASSGFGKSMTTVSVGGSTRKFFSNALSTKFGSTSGCSCSSGCSFTGTRIAGGREGCFMSTSIRLLSQCLSSGFISSLNGCSTSRVITGCKARMLAGVAMKNSCVTCCGSTVVRRGANARGGRAMDTKTGCGVSGINLSFSKA